MIYFMKIYNKTNPKIFNPLQPYTLGSSLFSYKLEKGKSLAFYYTLADKNIFNFEIFYTKKYTKYIRNILL